MIATGTSMTKTQNESCLEILLQFVGFLGALLGICIGITANSLCTADGGNSPRERAHIQPENQARHRNQGTSSRITNPWQSVYESSNRSHVTAAALPADKSADVYM